MAGNLLYRPEGAAVELGIGRSKVFELMASGELPSVQIGRSRRITREALEAYVARLVESTVEGDERDERDGHELVEVPALVRSRPQGAGRHGPRSPGSARESTQ